MGKVTLKQVYELAQKNKGEDRITKSDINQAKKSLGYKDPAPEIKDYMSKGGNAVKPVKAVLGVLALGAAGAIGAKKLMKKKSSTVSADDVKYTLKDKNMVTDLYQKATEQKTANMYTGGEVEVTKGGDYIKDLL
jgi:uncharacterized protein HemX